MTVAAPGVGKSQLWANIAHRMRVPTLYWSGDTDQTDVTIRSLALLTGMTTEVVEQRIDDTAWSEWMRGQLARSRHVDWVFDSSITPAGIDSRLEAFAELHGQYPALFVVDNLSNAITSPAEEYAQTKEVLGAVQRLARERKPHIAVLSHAKGEYENGTKPIPQGGGAQNPFKLPEVGLTLYRPDEDDRLGMCVVKNRGGPADPGAKRPVTFHIDLSRASVLGWTGVAV